MAGGPHRGSVPLFAHGHLSGPERFGLRGSLRGRWRGFRTGTGPGRGPGFPRCEGGRGSETEDPSVDPGCGCDVLPRPVPCFPGEAAESRPRPGTPGGSHLGRRGGSAIFLPGVLSFRLGPLFRMGGRGPGDERPGSSLGELGSSDPGGEWGSWFRGDRRSSLHLLEVLGTVGRRKSPRRGLSTLPSRGESQRPGEIVGVGEPLWEEARSFSAWG